MSGIYYLIADPAQYDPGTTPEEARLLAEEIAARLKERFPETSFLISATERPHEHVRPDVLRQIDAAVAKFRHNWMFAVRLGSQRPDD
jgi:hypothetical protein